MNKKTRHIVSIVLQAIIYAAAVFGLFSIAEVYLEVAFLFLTLFVYPVTLLYFYIHDSKKHECTPSVQRHAIFHAMNTTLIATVAAFLIVASGLIGVQKLTESTVKTSQLPQLEVSETDRKVRIPDSVLEMMNEDEWENESNGDKLALLQIVADYCSAELGIEKLTVEFAPYGSQQMYARLNEPEKKIEVRSDLLNLSFIGCAGNISRCAYRAYIIRLLEAYNAAPDWAKKLSIYDDVRALASDGTVNFGSTIDKYTDEEHVGILYSMGVQKYFDNRIFRLAEKNGKAVMSDRCYASVNLGMKALVYDRHVELVTYYSTISYDFDSIWTSRCFDESFADTTAMAKSFQYVDVNGDRGKDACFTDANGKQYVFLQIEGNYYEYSDKEYDILADNAENTPSEESVPSNPIDSFYDTHRLSEETSSNPDITNYAFAKADVWRAEFENGVSILKSSVNKNYADREYIDEALEKMSAGMESLTEYGSDIVTLASSSNVFVDPENDKYDEEIYEGTGAGVSRANTIADMYRSEALRLYNGILTVYENKDLDDLFIFDPDKLVETLKSEGIELVKNRIENRNKYRECGKMRIYYDSVEKRNEAHVLLDKGEMTELSIAMPCSISLAVGRIIIDYLKQVCVEMDSARQRADIILDDIKEVLSVLFCRLEEYENKGKREATLQYRTLLQDLDGFPSDGSDEMPIIWTQIQDDGNKWSE